MRDLVLEQLSLAFVGCNHLVGVKNSVTVTAARSRLQALSVLLFVAFA